MTLQPAEVLFPDAELWGTGRLRAMLAGRAESYAQDVFVSNAVPSTRRPRMVTIRRDGGAESGVFDNPRLGVNVWAATEQDVINLTRLVAALMRQMPGDGTCVRMQVGGANPIPDAQPRRFMSCEARLRGTNLEV